MVSAINLVTFAKLVSPGGVRAVAAEDVFSRRIVGFGVPDPDCRLIGNSPPTGLTRGPVTLDFEARCGFRVCAGSSLPDFHSSEE